MIRLDKHYELMVTLGVDEALSLNLDRMVSEAINKAYQPSPDSEPRG